MAITFHEEDLPSQDLFGSGPIAVDTEAMGLHPGRDRLCLVQLSDGSGDEHLVRFSPGSDYAAPNLKALLADPARVKLYHYGRFDIAAVGRHRMRVVETDGGATYLRATVEPLHTYASTGAGS